MVAVVLRRHEAHRGRGLTTVLTTAAIAFVREHGGTAIEVYPSDTTERMADPTLYTGRASTFSALGFAEVQRRAPHKPMMRLEVS